MSAQDAAVPTLLDPNVPVFRLIVTGSSTWRGRVSVWVPLDRMLAKHGRIVLRNGKAKRGLDRIVSDWTAARTGRGVTEDPQPADWAAHGMRAGFLRNQKLVDAGGDALMAWVDPCRRRRVWCPPGTHPSHGTADCVKRARKAGIPVYFSPRGMSW